LSTLIIQFVLLLLLINLVVDSAHANTKYIPIINPMEQKSSHWMKRLDEGLLE